MLIDIFARRYADVPLREQTFSETDKRLLVQAFRILEEDLAPYWVDGKESERGKTFWTDLHKRLSRELGLVELSPLYWTEYRMVAGNRTPTTHKSPMVWVCRKWMLKEPEAWTVDPFIKERLSLIELGFRMREEELAEENARLPAALNSELARFVASSRMRVPGEPGAGMKAWNATKNRLFKEAVEELNARFRQAAYPLHYHNGFIQAATDELLQAEVETPFWTLAAEAKWKNVDHDMKEALDLRDSDGRDPSFYAARSLESTIKIISDNNGWTSGKEKGASNYIDNLASKANGFITQWEAAMLRDFFRSVRNPFGHGPGSEEMPKLSRPQTEWAIEFCMSWIKSLIRRL